MKKFQFKTKEIQCKATEFQLKIEISITNKIIANRLDSNRDFTDLITGNLTGTINITEE